MVVAIRGLAWAIVVLTRGTNGTWRSKERMGRRDVAERGKQISSL